jgi:hypothetical protein
MRDLYARLSLPPGASDAQIKAAIKACPHADVRSDASAVLLHPGRRRDYDDLHATLVRIGSLRASLGLVQTRLWRDQREFNGEVTGTASRYGEFIQKRNMMSAARPPSPSSRSAPAFAEQSLRSRLRRTVAALLASAGQARKP